MADVADRQLHDDIIAALKDVPNEQLPAIVANLGGHDLPKLLQVLQQADAVPDRPVVIFAYTVKGYGLPIAGDPMNHSQLLTNQQLDEVRTRMGIEEDAIWNAFPVDSAAGEWCAGAAKRLQYEPLGIDLDPANVPADVATRHPNATSTQEAFGRTLLRLGGDSADRRTGGDDVAGCRDLDAPCRVDQQGGRLCPRCRDRLRQRRATHVALAIAVRGSISNSGFPR